MNKTFWNGKIKMWNIIKNFFIPKIEILEIILKVIPDKKEFDRNYHHWIVSQHAQQRIRERNFDFWHINAGFKYGKITNLGLHVELMNIPSEELLSLSLDKRKKLQETFPFTIILDKEKKVIKTIYADYKHTKPKPFKKKHFKVKYECD